MKKRALSFLLCLLMVLPLMLTSCDLFGSKDPDNTTRVEEEDIYVKPITLNFHIIADKAVSADDEAAVEAEFNAISKSLFKTQVDFIFYTKDEYDTKLLQNLDAAKAIGGASAANKFENSEVVTSLNDLNIPIEAYPEVENNQVDIVLINSKELYQELRSKNYLDEISNELSTKFTDITQRVNYRLVDGAKENGNMFAVPNNVLIGRYEMVLVHEDMAYLANYLQKEDFLTEIDSVKNCLNYDALRDFAALIQEIKESDDPEYAGLYATMKERFGVSDIYPMAGTFDYPTVTYFPMAEKVDLGNGKYSVEYKGTSLGVIYPFNATYRAYPVKLTNVFSNASYVSHKTLMLEATENGYYPTTTAENVAYGIQYVTGSYVDIGKYENAGYMVFEIDTPRLESDAAFSAMFAVTNYSASVDRSLEIIQALVAGTSDEEIELRNILQYGVEGYHYTKAEKTDSVTRLRETYMMDANYTGNLVTAYPCAADGRDESFIGYFTEQNKDATLNPLNGMSSDLLFGNATADMQRLYVCNEIIKLLNEELSSDEHPLYASMKALADKDAKIAAKRLQLKNNIPQITYYPEADYNESYARLLQYWQDSRAGIDPTEEKTETSPVAPSEVVSAINAEIKALQTAAKAAAEAYLAESSEAAKTLWTWAEACTTVEEFNAFLDRVAKISNVNATDLTEEELAIRTALYGKTATPFYGLLHTGGSTSNVLPSTLADALAKWYYTLK